MSNLMCRQPIDRRLPDPTDGICESLVDCSPGLETQEPIRVRVRVRQYGDPLAESGVRSARPNFGPLPVGTLLDCYV
jgi:hypothetical protein